MLLRRLLPLLLLPLLAFHLTGCGGGDGDGGLGSRKIVLWEMMDPPERELLAVHIAQFEADNPGVEVDVAHAGVEDIRNNFLTAALGGGGPDVVYGPSDQVGPFSIAGTLRPLDNVFGEAFFEQFHPLALRRLNGHLWAVPEQFGNHLLLVCNKAFVPEPPTNTADFIRLAKENTVDEDGDGTTDRYGLAFETKEPFWLAPWLGGYGGWVMNDAFEPTLGSDAMAKALTFLRDLKTEHAVLPRDCDYQLSDTLFKEGRAAMTINGPWSWSSYQEAGIELVLAPIPKLSDVDAWPTPMVSYRGYSIAKSCPDERLPLAMELVEHLTSAEVQLDYSQKLGSLPSILAMQTDGRIESDPMLSASMAQVLLGQPMPIVPEMRAIWDAMRPEMQNVMNGESTPADAARAMQETATRKIAEMRGL